MIGFAAAALALGSLDALPSPPLMPTGQWLVEGEDNMCALSHAFGSGKEAVTLALRPWPLGSTYDVLLFSRSGAEGVRYDTASISVDDAPASKPEQSVEYALTKGEKRLLSFKAEGGGLDALATAHRITLEMGKRRLVLSLAGTERAAAVLGSCQKLLRQQLGIDLIAADPAHEAKPRGREAAWFTPDNYPTSAISGGAQGVSRLLLTISPDGRVAKCVAFGSSGNAAIDRAACQGFQLRGRYTPATTPVGTPTTSWVQQSVRWQLP